MKEEMTMPTRRRPPKRDYTEVRRFAAHRRAGHEWWIWYVIVEPLLRRVGPFLVAAIALGLAWWRIPHMTLGIICSALAVGTGVVWAMWSMSDANLQRAMNGVKRGTGLGWAVGTVITALVTAAGISFFGG